MIAASPPLNLAAVLLGSALTLSCHAEVSEDGCAACAGDTPEAAAALPADARAVTQHVLPSPTGDLRYEATAAALTLKDGKGRPSSRLFYIAYVREGNELRPLTFVFNGGPGAASAYLHLGAMGPRRVVLEEDGSVPPPPVRLTDNAQTWFPFTDLVFVDPPGTGYSRLLGDYSTGEKEAKKVHDGKIPAWGIEEDVEVLGAFIRRYLTQERGGLPPSSSPARATEASAWPCWPSGCSRT
jgi:carboxypeptidase C (cathepsin A)